MSRVSPLDQNPHAVEQLAKMLADGVNRQQIAEHFGVHRETVSIWKKRNDVRQKLSALTDDRVNNILSRTDSKIMAWLDSSAGQKADIETLLKVRKEFVPDRIEVTQKGDAGVATAELMRVLQNDPELAQRLAAAMPDEAPGPSE